MYILCLNHHPFMSFFTLLLVLQMGRPYWLIGSLLVVSLVVVSSLPVSVEFGTNLTPHIKDRLTWLVNQIPSSSSPVCASKSWNQFAESENHANCAAPVNRLVLSFGNTAAASKLIPSSDLASLGPEGFIVAASQGSDGVLTLVGNGNDDPSITMYTHSSIGATMASYALLESLGFGFLHPLQPTLPLAWTLPSVTGILLKESPRWPFRGFHIHTEHPLEMTDVLNGFDVRDANDSSHNEDWSSMVPSEYTNLLTVCYSFATPSSCYYV
jgi:hypothetical protein